MSCRWIGEPDMELVEYLQGKIERRLQFYEMGAKRIDAPYLAEVERLARQTEKRDPHGGDDYARFYRERMTQGYILWAIDRIRFLLRLGKVDEADRRAEQLHNEIQFVDGLLRRRYFAAGAAAIEGGRAGAERTHGSAAVRATKRQKVVDDHNAYRAKGLPVGEADEAAAKDNRIRPRTVRAYRSPKK
jgi:hypothetical protein